MRKFVNPFSENFLPVWELWKEYKSEQWKFKYKSVITEQGAVSDLVKLSDGDEDTAIAIINQSINRGWKGFFKLKTLKVSDNGAKQTNSNASTRQSLNDLYNQRFGAGR